MFTAVFCMSCQLLGRQALLTDTNIDTVRNFKDYEDFTPNPKKDKQHRQGHIWDRSRSSKEIKEQLDRIKGHLVWMPLDFLCDAPMAENALLVNQITESVYT